MSQMVNKLSCKVGVGGVWHVPFIAALGMGNEAEPLPSLRLRMTLLMRL